MCAQPSWQQSFWSRTPAPRSKSSPLAPLPLPPPLPLPLYRPLPLLHPPPLSIPLLVHLCVIRNINKTLQNRYINLWCCYIKVDSATTALQNGDFTYRCMLKQMHYRTPFSHNGSIKSGIIWKLRQSVLSGKNKTFWQYYINSEPCMVYYPIPNWLK